jgi:hypothetical protein
VIKIVTSAIEENENCFWSQFSTLVRWIWRSRVCMTDKKWKFQGLVNVPLHFVSDGYKMWEEAVYWLSRIKKTIKMMNWIHFLSISLSPVRLANRHFSYDLILNALSSHPHTLFSYLYKSVESTKNSNLVLCSTMRCSLLYPWELFLLLHFICSCIQ